MTVEQVTVEQVTEAQVMKAMKAQLTDPLAIFRLAFLFRPPLFHHYQRAATASSCRFSLSGTWSAFLTVRIVATGILLSNFGPSVLVCINPA